MEQEGIHNPESSLPGPESPQEALRGRPRYLKIARLFRRTLEGTADMTAQAAPRTESVHRLKPYEQDELILLREYFPPDIDMIANALVIGVGRKVTIKVVPRDDRPGEQVVKSILPPRSE